MSLGAFARRGFVSLVLAVALIPPPARAQEGPAARPAPEVVRIAHGSVDQSFVPDPADPSRDLVTGRERRELEDDAIRYYQQLRRSDPGRFDRIRRRLLGEESADALEAHARSELVAGRPVAAEMAWRRVVEEHPDSPQAGPALVRLGSSLYQAGERVEAAEELAHLPELDLESAAGAAPLISRLLAEVEADLEREGPVSGKDKLRLHDSVEDPGLDRARELSEWISGWPLVDELARTLRLETSGDVLRKAKNVGADDLRLNKIVRLIPRDERVEAIRVEELLRDGTDLKQAEQRTRERTEGRKLEHLEDLARIQQLQVILLARALESMELEPAARRLGARTWDARRALVARLEGLARRPAEQLNPEEAAVARLVRLADVNGDGKLNPLRDDEGIWRPKRMAVEGDMRNAQLKPLDDDNKPAIARLFERMGTTEKALLHALVRACLEDGAAPGAASPRVSPERVDQLLARLDRRGRPAWAAANPRRGDPRPGEVELDYLSRLNVLRLPGEGLDDVLRRFVLEPARGSRTGGSDLAGDPAAAPLVAELASLGTRWQGAWLYEDTPGGATASQKFERAQLIRRELDDLAAERALDDLATALVADLESQGLRFEQGQVEALKTRLQHEDLGSLAMFFDDGGSLQDVFAFTEPGTKLGDLGPGHLAYGFGLDLQEGVPAGNVGWRGGRSLKEGNASLRYHVGATGLAAGPTDTVGVAAKFRRRAVWQPEIGADASILRGLAGRGFFNLIRDVNVKHRRKLDAVFAEHEAAKLDGRAAFVDSVTAEDAEAKPAVLFLESIGYRDRDYLHDSEAWVLLHDQYEFEKQRRRSELNREAWKVRFAGLGVTAAFFAGDAFLLAGPKLAVKDYRLFSRFVDGPDRRVQAEEARLRRAPIPSFPTFGRAERRSTITELRPEPAADGVTRFARVDREQRRAPLALPAAPEGVAHWPADLGPSEALLEELRVAQERRARELGRYASLEPSLTPSPLPPERAPRRAEDSRATALERLNAGLAARGVPLLIETTGFEHEYRLRPRGLTPWASQSLELYVSEEDGLALSLGEDGLPRLIAPFALDGAALDWMEEVRTVTRSGEADELHRACFSRAPGRSADEIIEGSEHFLRTEIVDGEVIGTVRLATRYRDAAGRPVRQANVIAPADEQAGERLAAAREAAARVPRAQLPELPPAPLLRSAQASELGGLDDPAALSPGFLAALRATSPAEVAAFKRRSLEHGLARASLVELDESRVSPWESRNVEYLQALSLRHHGRPLAGEALAHAHFVLTHEGLYRADGGPVARQVAHLSRRAVSPWDDGRELAGAPDARTRRLMELAGVDEAAARHELQSRVRAMVTEASSTGRLPRTTLPRGTRIVTASQSGPVRGVQWTTATEPLDAHLLAPLSLHSNEGRYVAALALGPDLPALAQAVGEELELRGHDPGSPAEVEAALLPAMARALAAPASEHRLRLALPEGVELELTLAEAPMAGALARCKNATAFPPAYGARLETHEDVLLASGPVTTVGVAEADTRFVGENWAGWRRLSLLAGLPFLFGDDDKTSTPQPEPEPVPPREGAVPPTGPRRGGVVPDRPVNQPEIRVDPRDGTQPPGGGGRGGDPPQPPGRERPEPPTEPPRGGENPPGGGGDDRPNPPDPPDRPRRPVD